MKSGEPPRIAAWLLEHCVLGDRRDALSGDLLEELRAGRSTLWYWRQVLSALVASRGRDMRNHTPLLVLAFVWSELFQPIYWLLLSRVEFHNNLIGHIWRIRWPWSTVLYLGGSLAFDFAFICAGAALYLLGRFLMAGSVNARALRRGVLASVPVYIAASGCILLLFSVLPVSPHPIDRRTLTFFNVIVTMGMPGVIGRVPCALAMLTAVWEAARPEKRRGFKLVV
jgi:hypothetical protein